MGAIRPPGTTPPERWQEPSRPCRRATLAPNRSCPDRQTFPVGALGRPAMRVVVDHFDLYWLGFVKTLGICLWAGTGALLLGTVLAAFRVSPVPPLRGTGTAYVTLVRNCPLTVVLFFVAFGLPEVGVNQSYYRFAVGGLIIYTAAFVCEAVRSGINAVSRPSGSRPGHRADVRPVAALCGVAPGPAQRRPAGGQRAHRHGEELGDRRRVRGGR